jgi:hypothetical protein
MGLHRKYCDQFERFWYVFPRKENKPQAEKEFLKLKLTEVEVDELIRHIETRKRNDRQWVPNEKGNTFIPYAERFLKHRRFEDEYEKIRSAPVVKRNYDVEEVKDDQPVVRTEAVARRALAQLKGLVH